MPRRALAGVRAAVAFAPWKVNTHRILTDMWYRWVVGYRRPGVQSSPFRQYIDIDNSRRFR